MAVLLYIVSIVYVCAAGATWTKSIFHTDNLRATRT